MADGSPAKNPSPIDRSLQLDMLTEMRGAYPEMVRGFGVNEDHLTDEVLPNLVYLQEHGLCDAQLSQGMDGHWHWAGAKITAKGLDFLEEDGGLSAILTVVTIKVHADTLRELIASKIDASTASKTEKSELKSQLQKLPGTVLQAASTDLIKQGIDHLPNAIHWVRLLTGIG